ncbi:MAG: hypothetical protein KGJ02_00040 [Verrucomicrobiota bacterium]|nr:hypothetical protein [Verrucomicrobiota bacterium]
MADQLSAILFRLMSAPIKSQIKIDFDKSNKIFKLSVPLLLIPKGIPPSLQKYLSSIQGMSFRPHKTTYRQEGNTQISLIQEIPFHQWGLQPTMRNQIVEFWHLAKHCHKLLLDIAAGEKVAKIERNVEG